MTVDTTKLPQHVAIIMDGNRRWAKKQGLAGVAGHTYAVDSVVEQLIEHAGEIGVKYLTLWAFSTENWGRDKAEVAAVMNLFRKALMTKVQRFIDKGARLKVIGDMSKFSPDIQQGMKAAIDKSMKNDKITVVFALNYGGRDEIKRAINRLLEENRNQESGISESLVEQYLDTAGTPDPDLIIRTGGEQRMSGFLMWSGAYSELYFTDILFPDFGVEQFDLAIEVYQKRQRRYGR